jgi:hypothetical protein
MLTDVEVDAAFPNQSHSIMSPRHGCTEMCASQRRDCCREGQMAQSEVWDMEETLYKFAGYKGMAGSIWTDGVRLVTDGDNNTVILHNGSSGASGIVTRV